MADEPCVIGEGIQIRGNLSGSGDLVVEGQVDGYIQLEDKLIVGETGKVVANVEVRDLAVDGAMNGDIQASQSVSISSTATVVSEVLEAPVIDIQDGARFRGRLEMNVPLPPDLQ